MATLRGLITLTLLLSFIAIVLWSLRGVHKSRFDLAARMPLEVDPPETIDTVVTASNGNTLK